MKRRRTQINLLGAWVDSITHEEALETILMWCGTRARQYVVTPNLDHCRLLRGDCDFSSAYEQSGLSVPDGWPLVAASRITEYPIRRRVTGADLVIPLCRALAANSFSVFLLGSSHEVLKASSEKLLQAAPGLAIRGIYSPPFGFERDKRQLDIIAGLITEARPHAVIVALGAPKQELWMRSNVPNLPIGVAIGVGGTLDFLAGKQHRAPQIFQALGLEWLWRGLSDPWRLGRRYLKCLVLLPVLATAHLVRHLVTKRDAIRHIDHVPVNWFLSR